MRRSHGPVVVGLVMVTSVVAVAVTGGITAASPSSSSVPGELIVRFEAGHGPEALGEDRLDVVDHRILSERLDIWLLELPDAAVQQAAAELVGNPLVATVEPNFRVTAATDPRYPLQWGLRNAWHGHAFLRGVPDMDVDAPEAWEVTTGDPDVVVAVTDTGVQTSHPDLAANIWTNTAEASGDPGVDDDENGLVDDVNGWDFANGDASVFDSNAEDAHGTHVAGTVAAAENGLGGLGVAPDTTVMPLKFLSADSGAVADAILAIEYAVEMGADVINASWTTPDFSANLHTTIESSGLPVIAAAGNSGTDADTSPEYPAAFDLPNVLSVAAIDPSGALAGFSNFGDDTVDVGAPGSRVLSTLPSDSYGYLDGTSMAAPHAAGVAALYLSVTPTASAADVIQHVVQTGRPIRSLQGVTTSGRLVDAAAAVGGTKADIRSGPRTATTPSSVDTPPDIRRATRSDGRQPGR